MVVIAILIVVAAVLIGGVPFLVEKSTQYIPMGAGPYVKSEDIESTLYNLVVFFTLLLIATVLIYLLFSKRRILNIFLYTVWYLISVGVIQFYTILYYLSGLLNETIAVVLMPASFLIGGAVVYLVYKRRGDIILGFIGSLAGVMFVSLLPEMTIVMLLVALPIYDYIMVSRGLLGKLIKKSKESVVNKDVDVKRGDTPLFGFVVRLKTLSLGVGDFVVYAMALSYIFINNLRLGLELAIFLLGVGAFLIYLGFVLTVEVFLKRWGYGPALPFPILALFPLILLTWLI
ncbi:MAG: hypothetical protein QW610_06140 [Pyrobaculum sp.]